MNESLASISLVLVLKIIFLPGRSPISRKKAIQSAPPHYKTHAAMGSCYLKEKKLEEALNNYQQSCSIEPGNTIALNGIGVSYMMMFLDNDKNLSQAEKALEYWHLSLEIDFSQQSIRNLVEKYQPVVHQESKISDGKSS